MSHSKPLRIYVEGNIGSGKTTLLDIIMGLLHPTRGYMAIDGTVINKKNKNV